MTKKLCLLAILILPLYMVGFFQDSVKLYKRNTHFVLFSVGYRIPVGKSIIINSGHGICVEVGINLGHLFSKKSVVGLFAGWAWKDNLWSTAFNQKFINDYHSAIDNEHQLSSLDSLVVSRSSELFANKKGRSVTMPGCEMSSFHNYSLYYGVIIKLPLHSKAPIIKLYRGTTRTHFQGGGNLITNQKDYNILQLRRAMYGCEIMASNPLSIFYKNDDVPSYFERLGVSVYYEYSDFTKSSLYFYDGEQSTRIPLKNFTNSSFLEKYKNEHRIGCKVSFNIL